MAHLWEVVGGADKGGILVREGQGLKSPEATDRLSTGAVVEELDLIGDRLHFKLVPGKGTGPKEGWVSLSLKDKDLVVPKIDEDMGGPAETGGKVELNENLKEEIVASANEKAKIEVPETIQKRFNTKTEFNRFVPSYHVFKFPLSGPKYRILCFHNAGSTHTNYSARNTPFTKWIKDVGTVEFLALQYPGRENLTDDPPHTSVDTLCPLLLAMIYHKIADGVPYLVWSHSVGTWVAFEFLMLARRIGLPMPKAAIFNAFPAPHMPMNMRPWRRSRRLNTEQLKVELKNWDIKHFEGPGAMVFRDDQWPIWDKLMRIDFPLFDEYRFKHNGTPRFDFPLHCRHFEEEYFNKPEMIEMWKDWTTDKFDFKIMKGMGHLNCFYNPSNKDTFFTEMTDILKSYCADA